MDDNRYKSYIGPDKIKELYDEVYDEGYSDLLGYSLPDDLEELDFDNVISLDKHRKKKKHNKRASSNHDGGAKKKAA